HAVAVDGGWRGSSDRSRDASLPATGGERARAASRGSFRRPSTRRRWSGALTQYGLAAVRLRRRDVRRILDLLVEDGDDLRVARQRLRNDESRAFVAR